jgi:hypothetical protein
VRVCHLCSQRACVEYQLGACQFYWAAMGNIVPLLDAFEADMGSKTARRH